MCNYVPESLECSNCGRCLLSVQHRIINGFMVLLQVSARDQEPHSRGDPALYEALKRPGSVMKPLPRSSSNTRPLAARSRAVSLSEVQSLRTSCSGKGNCLGISNVPLHCHQTLHKTHTYPVANFTTKLMSFTAKNVPS